MGVQCRAQIWGQSTRYGGDDPTDLGDLPTSIELELHRQGTPQEEATVSRKSKPVEFPLVIGNVGTAACEFAFIIRRIAR